MSTKQPPLFQLDFRARHSVASGMTNAALTAVTAAVLLHVASRAGALSTLRANLLTALVVVVGVLITLAWGAFGSPARGQIIHRIATWTAAGAWVTSAVVAAWTPGNLLTGLTGLAVGAVALGFGGWMATPTADPDRVAEDIEHADEMAAGYERDAIGQEWEKRIKRVANMTVRVEGVQDFDIKTNAGEPTGYTIEVHVPSGGASWRNLAQHQDGFASDMAMGPGCDVSVRMGAHRRVALIDVTTIDILKEEQLYPTDYSPLSILDMLPMMTNRRGETCGPVLRERNAAIYGMGRSGKSNTLQVMMAGLARMTDALTCTIDLTGIRLSLPMLRPFLNGRTSHPAIWWVADTEDEAILLLRALNRGAIARNDGCNEIKFEVDNDKIPVGRTLPAFITVVDESKYVCGRNANQTIYDLMRKITDDHRDPAFRAIIAALRGTDDIITQGFQAQMHVAGIMKPADRAEIRNALGTGTDHISPSDTPYPGCAQMRLDESEPVKPYHVWRLTPKQINDIGEAVADYQPIVDTLTWLALNGRHADGTPYEGLYEGELDCAQTRWVRFGERNGYPNLGVDYGPLDPDVQLPEQDPTSVAGKPPAACSAVELSGLFSELSTGFSDALDGLTKSVDSSGQGMSDADIEREVSRFDPDAALREIFGDVPTVVQGAPVPPTTNDTWEMIYRIIVDAGESGIPASMIRERMIERGVKSDRATVYKWIKEMAEGPYADRIERRADKQGGRNGRWYSR